MTSLLTEAKKNMLTEAKKNMAAESAKRLQVHHLENRNAEEAQGDPLEALETMEDVGGIKQRLKVDTLMHTAYFPQDCWCRHRHTH